MCWRGNTGEPSIARVDNFSHRSTVKPPSSYIGEGSYDISDHLLEKARTNHPKRNDVISQL
jgi:hypothetical protein